MKTFEEALKRAIDAAPFTPGLDEGEYNDGFIDGLYYAQELLGIHRGAAINEILTKYQEWAFNLTDAQVTNWEDKEGSFERTKARIRKEFIELINKQNKSQ